MSNIYDDIINLPHPNPITRPRMSIANRAAQFSPFAALTGHDAAVKDTARLTNEKRDLDENLLTDLDEKMRLLTGFLAEQPEVTITYFKQDTKKAGGVYAPVTGNLRRIDNFEGVLILTSGERILLEHILEIESELFKT